MDDQDVVFDFENQAIGVVNADAPPPRSVAFEGFGLAKTGVSVAVNTLEKQVQTAQGLAVPRFPFLELLPGDVRPELLHGGKFSLSRGLLRCLQEEAATRGNDNSCDRFRSPKRPVQAVRGL